MKKQQTSAFHGLLPDPNVHCEKADFNKDNPDDVFEQSSPLHFSVGQVPSSKVLPQPHLPPRNILTFIALSFKTAGVVFVTDLLKLLLFHIQDCEIRGVLGHCRL